MNSLYSAFVVEPGVKYVNTNLFTYQRSQTLPHSRNNDPARDVHTNVPRSMDVGLPMGWIMRADQWRAGCNMRYLVDDVLEWASTISLELRYTGRSIQRTPLSDLLMSPRLLSDPDPRWRDVGYTNVQTRLNPRPNSAVFLENLGWYVEARSTSNDAHELLDNYLIENARQIQGKTIEPKLIVWVWIEGLLINEGTF